MKTAPVKYLCDDCKFLSVSLSGIKFCSIDNRKVFDFGWDEECYKYKRKKTPLDLLAERLNERRE